MHNDSNSNSEPAVAFEAVGKTYEPLGTVALRNASFRVSRGEFVCIIGPSGEGKSTILKIIAGLEHESSGSVRRPQRVSMAFQSGALFPWLTVEENIELGLRPMHLPNKKMTEIVRQQVELLELGGLEKKRPPELSGGQAQRVGIGRALAIDPDVLLLDEPFSALDPKTTAELHDDLIKIWEHTHKTIIMVSHNIEEAVSLADRVLLVREGQVEREYPVALPYPRREQGEAFLHIVQEIRKEFFKDSETQRA
ncbi:MAG: ABC transporter ATP-binding protein [Patescibacteria group bacterium]|nr:ABC transporter ATP-binding protein [Patescibacteria group bacterium]